MTVAKNGSSCANAPTVERHANTIVNKNFGVNHKRISNILLEAPRFLVVKMVTAIMLEQNIKTTQEIKAGMERSVMTGFQLLRSNFTRCSGCTYVTIHQ